MKSKLIILNVIQNCMVCSKSCKETQSLIKKEMFMQ